MYKTGRGGGGGVSEVLNVIYKYLKFDVSKYIIKRDILVQKVYLIKSFFIFLTLKLNDVFIYNYLIYIVR